MTITFLGSGSAFVLPQENYHSMILFEKTIKETEFANTHGQSVVAIGEIQNTYRLLFDAGPTIAEALNSNNLQPQDINTIFISHLHGDHIHGLEYIGFKTFFSNEYGKQKIRLVANVQVLEKLWNDVLKGTMESISGKRLTLEDYFNTVYIKPRDSFKFAKTEFILTKVPHVINDVEEVPAYGIKFTEDDINIFITGDTMFDFWKHIGNYEWANIIFHDCEFKNYPNGVHAQFHQLKELPIEYKKKMWLYHYMLDGKTFDELEKDVTDAGFAGLVKRGQKFDTKELRRIKDDIN